MSRPARPALRVLAAVALCGRLLLAPGAAAATTPGSDPDADRRAALATLATLTLLGVGAGSTIANAVYVSRGERAPIAGWLGVGTGALLGGIVLAASVSSDFASPSPSGLATGLALSGAMVGLGIAALRAPAPRPPASTLASLTPVPVVDSHGGGLALVGRF